MSRAVAFVPAHLSVIFSVHLAEDPRAAGSRGAGIVIDDGVYVTVSEGNGCTLNGETRTIDPVDRLTDALGVEATVAIETDLPLGQGFGISGAATLGTALAANAAFDLAMTENALIEAAHVAEVEAGTGLGDVVAQARGGVPLRLDPGAPGYGMIDAIPVRTDLEYYSLGSIDTVDVLAGATESISAAGDRAVEHLQATPTLEALFRLGVSFSREADLLPADVAAVIEDVEAAGGRACVGHLGKTVVAIDRGLSQAGYDAVPSAVYPTGAALLRGE